MNAASKQPDAYVVYEPPVEGYPFLGVLFRAERPPQVFVFPTQEEAIAFLTSRALEKLPPSPDTTRGAKRNVAPADDRTPALLDSGRHFLSMRRTFRDE